MSAVLAWLLGILIPAAFGVLAVHDYKLAKLGFLISAAVAALWSMTWIVGLPLRDVARAALGLVLFVLIGAAFRASSVWVDERREAETAAPEKLVLTHSTPVPAPTTSKPTVEIKMAPGDSVEPQPLKITPKELVAFFEGRTTAEAERSLKPFMGGKIRVSGAITDVQCRDYLRTISLRVEGVQVIANFEKEWASELERRRKNESVVLAGTLDYVESSCIILAGSEILS